ncbi:YceI family protein [Fulvivirga maritima]|uniref:YceI family protein n=1 Tax=Fulvivirga maritima TaxID=2904247 RepID=UPI001F328509|nr:YceI family protein [Fulvivirga maritima]UII24401.1 YceI family protein [Fulvivirga maritima]
MKKLAIICMGIFLIATSCNQPKKGEESSASEETEATSAEGGFSIVETSAEVKFTAYKTTDKVPVGGTFKTINFTKTNSGATPLEALDGTEFSIPVKSLNTNDATGTRDPKIVSFFFGVMTDTENITGTFKLGEDKESASVDITLNGQTANIPLTYEVTSETYYTFKGVMNLEDWDALDAVASINKACEALHTGPDGVSKTWSEVGLEAEVSFKKN